jgi:single-strand DNA-binding protein
MNNLNSIILEGNLCADPELKHTPAGTCVGNFRLGSNRFYKNGEGDRVDEASFFDIEVWGRLAETCNEYLVKGREVRVVGRLKQDRWQDPDGNNQTRVKIVGEHVEFRSRPKVTEDVDAQVDEAAEADL